MPLTTNALKEKAATRAFAKERARVGAKDSRWRGGGDYYFELTPEGIRVTGGDAATGGLQGGKSTLVGWDNPMVDAILEEQGSPDSELGAVYKPTEKTYAYEAEPIAITGKPAGGGEYQSEDAAKEGEPRPPEPTSEDEEGTSLRATPVRGAPDSHNWKPPSTAGGNKRALLEAARQGVDSGDVQFDERRPIVVFDTKTGGYRLGTQADVFVDDLDKHR